MPRPSANRNRFINLGQDIASYGIMSGLASLVGFLLLPIFTRIFSTADYGAIDIIATLTSLTAISLRLSLPSAITRFYHEYHQQDQRNTLISTLFLAVLFACLLLLLLSPTVSVFLSRHLLHDPASNIFITYGLMTGMLAALTSIPSMALRMQRRIFRYNTLHLIYTFIYAAFALYFIVVLDSGIIGAFQAALLASAIQLSLALLWTKHLFVSQVSFPFLFRSLKYSLPNLPGVLLTWLNKQVDRLILLSLLGLGPVGIFGAASRISTLTNLPAAIFGQAWYPYALSLLKIPTRDRDRFYEQTLYYFAGGFACLGLALTAVSPEIFHILPDEYHRGWLLIPWLAGAAILHTSGKMTNMGIVLSQKTYANTVAAIFAILINLLLALWLIPTIGLNGAAIGSFVAELVFTSTLYFYTTRHSHLRFRLTPLLSTLITYILIAALIIWLAITLPGLSSISIRLLLLLAAIIFITRQTIYAQPAQTSTM